MDFDPDEFLASTAPAAPSTTPKAELTGFDPDEFLAQTEHMAPTDPVEAYAKDKNFDYLAHPAQYEKDTPNYNAALDFALKVRNKRSELGIGPSVYEKAEGSAEGFGNFLMGGPSAIYNTAAQVVNRGRAAFESDPEKAKSLRNDADKNALISTLQAQNAEAGLKHTLHSISNFAGRIIRAAPDERDPFSGEVVKEPEWSAHKDELSSLRDEVENARDRRNIESGNVVDHGVVAGLVRAREDVAGAIAKASDSNVTPVAKAEYWGEPTQTDESAADAVRSDLDSDPQTKASEYAPSPKDLKAQGIPFTGGNDTPWFKPSDSRLVKSGGATSDPAMFLYSLVPTVPGVASVMKKAGGALEAVAEAGPKLAKGISPTAKKVLGAGALGVGALGGFEAAKAAIHHPEAAAGAAGLALALWGTRGIGSFIRTTGEMAGGALPAETMGAIGVTARKALGGAVNVATVGGIQGKILDGDLTSGAMGGFLFGSLGAGGQREIRQAAAAKAMSEAGAKIRTGNARVDAENESYRSQFSPESQSAFDRLRAHLFGSSGTHLVVVSAPTFLEAQKGQSVQSGDSMGVFRTNDQFVRSADGKTIYLNADSIADAYGQTKGGGEVNVAGHEIGHSVIDYLKTASRLSDAAGVFQSVRQGLTQAQLFEFEESYKNALKEGGASRETMDALHRSIQGRISDISGRMEEALGRPPTQEEMLGAFSDDKDASRILALFREKQAAFARNKNIDDSLNGDYFSEEAAAEMTRKILNGEDISGFALPKTLKERITDSVDRMLENTGIKPSASKDSDLAFKGRSVAETMRQMRDMLYEQGAKAKESRLKEGEDPNIRERAQAVDQRIAEIDAIRANPPKITPESPALMEESPAAGLAKEREDLIAERNRLMRSVGRPQGLNRPVEPALATETPKEPQKGALSEEPSPIDRVGLSTHVISEALRKSRLDIGGKPPSNVRAKKGQPETGRKGVDIAREQGEQFEAALDDLIEQTAKTGGTLPNNVTDLSILVNEHAMKMETPVSSDNTKEQKVPTMEEIREEAPKRGALSEPVESPSRETSSEPIPEPRDGRQFSEDKPHADKQEIEEAVAIAETDAMVAEKHKKPSKAGQKRVRDAKRNAILDIVTRDGNADPELLQKRVEDGKVSYSGRIDPSIPSHKALLDHLNIPESAHVAISELNEKMGQTIHLDYASAPVIDGTDQTAPGHQERYNASSAADRKAGGESEPVAGKPFYPVKLVVNKDSITVLGFSPERLMKNLEKLITHLQNEGVDTGYSGVNDPALLRDVKAYSENHEKGLTGDGSRAVMGPDGEPMAGSDVVDGAHKIPRNRFDILNAAWKYEAGAKFDSDKPGARERGMAAHELAAENGWIGNEGADDVNPLRDYINKSGRLVAKNERGEARSGTGEVLENVWEHLSPELISNVRGEAGERHTVRESGFTGDHRDMTRSGLPKGALVEAGFMPKPASSDNTKGALSGESKEYPRVSGGKVSGMTVRAQVPNRSSIRSSFENPEILKGIREIPMDDLRDPESKGYSAADDISRVDKLAGEIRQSGEINPLIVGIDENGSLEVIEGRHRLEALAKNNAKSVPALVVREKIEYMVSKKGDGETPYFIHRKGTDQAISRHATAEEAWDAADATQEGSKFMPKESSSFNTKKGALAEDGEKYTYAQPERIKRRPFEDREELVSIDIPAFEKAWSGAWLEKDMLIPPGGGGAEINGRREGFRQWLKDNPGKAIETPEISVNERGEPSFTNGRHRYSVIRDGGEASMGVSMSPKSVENARKAGLLADKAKFMPSSDNTKKGALNEDKPVLDISKRSGDADFILEGDEFDYKWRERNVPVSLFSEYKEVNKDKTKELKGSDISSIIKKNPPLFFEREDGSLKLLDGNHRIIEARNQGLKEIPILLAKEESNDSSFMPSEKKGALNQDELGFYSGLRKMVEEKIPKRASGEQILATLKGAKREEMEWLGLPQFLEGKSSVSKDELLEFIDSNKVEMKEVYKRDGVEPLTNSEVRTLRGLEEDAERIGLSARDREKMDDLRARELAEFDGNSADPTKFSQWKLDGGENYKEVLLTLPANKLTFEEYKQQQAAMGVTNEETLKQWYKHLSPDDGFKSSHWDEPNVIAHIRQADHKDTEGNKVRVIEEIQSDWMQSKRKQDMQNADAIKESWVEIVTRMKKDGILKVVC